MRDDAWLAQRLGRPALTWEPGDDPGAVAAAARERAPAFAQAKVPCEDVATVGALERAGFGVVDVNVTLERSPEALSGPADVAVAPAQAAQAPALLELAERHFTVSRFHLDPGVGAEAAAAIKRDWVQAYLDGERGETLLAAEHGGRVAGFLGVIGGEGAAKVIDVVAVDPGHRRAGVGRALVAALAGGPIVVGTQAGNIGSLRFYDSLGFVISATRYVLHLHA